MAEDLAALEALASVQGGSREEAPAKRARVSSSNALEVEEFPGCGAGRLLLRRA